MRLRRSASRIVYIDADENIVERDEMLAQVQGKSLSEGKEIVAQHEKTTMYEWVDREGNVVARTYGNLVAQVEVKPADADARRAEYLRRLREAQAKCARPDATPQDMAEAMRLMIEYQEFLDLLAD